MREANSRRRSRAIKLEKKFWSILSPSKFRKTHLTYNRIEQQERIVFKIPCSVIGIKEKKEQRNNPIHIEQKEINTMTQ